MLELLHMIDSAAQETKFKCFTVGWRR